MTVREMVRVVRRRWWALVGCVVLGLVIAGIAGALAPPQYTSSARVLVATPDVDQGSLVPPGGIGASQRAVNYANLVTGTAIPQKVIQDLGLTEPVEQLLKQVEVDVIAGTTIIEITATDSNPSRAQHIAQAFADELSAAVPKIESEAGAAQTPASVTVTDPAPFPDQPAPRGLASTLALGFVAGLVVGAALLWLLEYLDNSVRRRRDLERLTGAPVLGTVGATKGAGPHLAGPRDDRAEAYRVVRTALQFADVPNQVPVFAVAGVHAGDGASTTAANLALAMARAGQRVLVVDADLHRPRLAQLFGLPAGQPGLAEVLTGAAAVDRAIQRWSGSTLDVLGSGSVPEDPTEQVQSRAMDELLTALRSRYDVIVLDTPPAVELSDAALLGAAADGVILVARYGRTTDEDVTAAVERLSVVHARLVGSVLTSVPRPNRVPDASYRSQPPALPTRAPAEPTTDGGRTAGATEPRSGSPVDR
ncbi:MAG TPA: polysaccharide biosynthesis tyrosine autokinase [Nakamurella sp.]|nr:polysaccharide biosynthesis tyrosine autokinase [Nakamurella sp.]